MTRRLSIVVVLTILCRFALGTCDGFHYTFSADVTNGRLNAFAYTVYIRTRRALRHCLSPRVFNM